MSHIARNRHGGARMAPSASQVRVHIGKNIYTLPTYIALRRSDTRDLLSHLPRSEKDQLSNRRNQLAKDVGCGRLLRFHSEPPCLDLALASYCGIRTLCVLCGCIAAHKLALLRGSGLGNDVFDFVVHWPSAADRDEAVEIAKASRHVADKIPGLRHKIKSNHHANIRDSLVVPHVKRPPGSDQLQPHLHILIEISDCVSVRDTLFYGQTSLEALADKVANDSSLPRYSTVKAQHTGRVSTNSNGPGKRITPFELEAFRAYLIHSGKDDVRPGDSLKRMDLLNAGGWKKMYRPAQLNVGRPSIPNEMATDHPLLCIPLVGQPIWVELKNRRKATRWLTTQASELVSAWFSSESLKAIVSAEVPKGLACSEAKKNEIFDGLPPDLEYV